MAVDSPAHNSPADVDMPDQPPEVQPQQATTVIVVPAPVQFNLGIPWYDPFLEYMYFRFGFTYPQEGPDYGDHAQWRGSLTDEELLTIRSHMLDTQSNLASPPIMRRHLFHFVKMLNSDDGPPASLWDLNPMNHRHLNRVNAPVTVDVVDAPESSEGGLKANSVFSLQAGQNQEGWRLYVRDPLVAVECLRREFVST